MNDVAAIFLSSIITSICEQAELPIEPFAMALATSANLGSAGTIIGNPKNMIIVEHMPETSFLQFTLHMFHPAFLGTFLNTALIVAYYGKRLKGRRLRNLNRLLKHRSRAGRNSIKYGEEVGSGESEVSEWEWEMFDDVLSFGGGGCCGAAYRGNRGVVDATEGEGEGRPLLGGDVGKKGRGKGKGRKGSVVIDVESEDSGHENNLRHRQSYQSFSSLSDQSSSTTTLSPAISPTNPHPPTPLPWLQPPAKLSSSNFSLSPMTPDFAFATREPLNLVELVHTIPRTVAYPTTLTGVVRYRVAVWLQKWARRVDMVNLGYGICLSGMYVGFVCGANTGFTTIFTAMSLLALSTLPLPTPTPHPHPRPPPDPTHTITTSINWGLLSYLFGIFIVLAGVTTTPLPSTIYAIFKPLLRHSNGFVATGSFVAVCMCVCLVFTSIPSVLRVSPVAGLIVCEVCWKGGEGGKEVGGDDGGKVGGGEGGRRQEKGRGDVEDRWIGDLWVWVRYAWWSNVLVLVGGVGVLAVIG
ncbi:hypothetical protein HDV00_007338 [Rhizophlyctis rosea]|nr:hypothetical protein HDV00_007338 [Rhizophlyctis rosea]